jgi:hypothetical protein
MLDFQIIQEILRLGLEGRTPVDPSRSPLLRGRGLAIVTSYIEQLSLLELLKDPCPMFGQDGGMWIGYALTDHARPLATDPEALRLAVGALLGGPVNEVSRSIHDLVDAVGGRPFRATYHGNLLARLNEMAICMDHDCFMAVMAHCGVILEILLKETLTRNHIPYDDNAGVGSLIGRLQAHPAAVYLDPGLKNIANIINQSRIQSVHHHETVPVPSRDQAIMVVYAIRDLTMRYLAGLDDPGAHPAGDEGAGTPRPPGPVTGTPAIP